MRIKVRFQQNREKGGNMTPEKVAEVAKKYRQYFTEKNVSAAVYTADTLDLLEINPKRIVGVIAMYRRMFEAQNIGKSDCSHRKILTEPILGLPHCHGMLDKILWFLSQGRNEKALRWVGFVRGVWWSQEEYPPVTVSIGHCLAAVVRIEILLTEKKFKEAFYVLGVVQGILWARGIYTLQDLKNHNRRKRRKNPSAGTTKNQKERDGWHN